MLCASVSDGLFHTAALAQQNTRYLVIDCLHMQTRCLNPLGMLTFCVNRVFRDDALSGGLPAAHLSVFSPPNGCRIALRSYLVRLHADLPPFPTYFVFRRHRCVRSCLKQMRKTLPS